MTATPLSYSDFPVFKTRLLSLTECHLDNEVQLSLEAGVALIGTLIEDYCIFHHNGFKPSIMLKRALDGDRNCKIGLIRAFKALFDDRYIGVPIQIHSVQGTYTARVTSVHCDPTNDYIAIAPKLLSTLLNENSEIDKLIFQYLYKEIVEDTTANEPKTQIEGFSMTTKTIEAASDSEMLGGWESVGKMPTTFQPYVVRADVLYFGLLQHVDGSFAARLGLRVDDCQMSRELHLGGVIEWMQHRQDAHQNEPWAPETADEKTAFAVLHAYVCGVMDQALTTGSLTLYGGWMPLQAVNADLSVNQYLPTFIL